MYIAKGKLARIQPLDPLVFVFFFFVKKGPVVNLYCICVCGMVYTGSSIIKFMFFTNFRVVHLGSSPFKLSMDQVHRGSHGLGVSEM